MMDWLISDNTLMVFGGLGAWYLAFPYVPSLFSEVGFRFEFLVKGQIGICDMQPDYR